MTLWSLIQAAKAEGMSIDVDGENLVIEADRDPSPALIAELRHNKAHLIALLRSERAAIIEHDGKVPRAWADGFARLDPDHAPADVPLPRWQRFIDDIGHFLDDGFAEVAAALGWSAFDLFGWDDTRPFGRIDQAGLPWLLNGDRLVALTAAAAVIEMRTGARLTYCRKPSGPGRVLAWELTV